MSGLAAKVRRVTDSDEFELSGYDQAKCDEFSKACFAEPFPLPNMIRLTFVVGGGKLVRQKYSDDLPKHFMTSLGAVGFKDDNAAVCEAASAGSYKFQHDTGKNLKYVHVFPRITGAAAAAAGGGEEGEEEDEEEEKPRTETDVLFQADEEEFARLMRTYLPSYGQKRRLLELLKSRIAELEAIEAKMARVEALTPEEQALFDDVGVEELKTKVKAVTAGLQQMMDAGELTSGEKTACLEQLDSKLELLQKELEKAEADGKAKRAEAFAQQRDLVQKTRGAVKDASPISLPPLKHAKELGKLHSKLAVLNKMEKASKGHYTLDELKQLGERPEIEEAISVLETRSRGWLEDDEVFQERVRACIRAAASAGGAAKKPSGGGGGASSGGFTSVGSGGARQSKAKAKSASTRNAFSALG